MARRFRYSTRLATPSGLQPLEESGSALRGAVFFIGCARKVRCNIAARVPLARSMARAAPCALLALADAKAPSPTARRLPDVRGLRRVFGCRSFPRCRSTTIVIGVLSVLRCRARGYFGGGSHCALAGAHAAGA